ncbi:hypothetical protein CYCD_16440 [Tenuifilaceae bacterium CYCD]|nr:hypothetical protein CYCD_16440 [Tenuifilaceae bacterium CYCD]
MFNAIKMEYTPKLKFNTRLLIKSVMYVPNKAPTMPIKAKVMDTFTWILPF